MPRPAVVLLSGGLDSATTAFLARRDGFDVHALSVRYGQRHQVELDAAAAVAQAVGAVDHRVVAVDLGTFGGSALTDSSIAVPKDRADDGRIPSTYVPARNTVLLALALADAEVVESTDVFIGVNALDYSGYPDCRPAFIDAFERLAALGTRAAVEDGRAVRIHAPLIDLTKAEIIELGTRLGVDYAMTISCYDPAPDGGACGACDACVLRRKGFADAGLADPTRYASGAR